MVCEGRDSSSIGADESLECQLRHLRELFHSFKLNFGKRLGTVLNKLLRALGHALGIAAPFAADRVADALLPLAARMLRLIIAAYAPANTGIHLSGDREYK